MRYYIIKNSSGQIIGYNQTNGCVPASAIEISFEEYQALGFYIPTPEPALDALQAENKLLKAQLKAQTDRADFIEDCIAEMAVKVYEE